MIEQSIWAAIISSCLLFVVGCARWLPTPVPLTTVEEFSPEQADRLYVFLPGIGDNAKGYQRQGFLSALREQMASAGKSVDMIAANAHIGYYAKEIVVERIHEDIVRPAKQAGYQEIWLVGISLGGLGSLLYAREHGDQIDGIVALAPYLGEPELIDEIVAAGGPRVWKPGTISEDDYARQLWDWLQDYPVEASSRPELHLLYGADDRFATANAMLASLIPPERSQTVPGGHKWPVWKKLWSNFLVQEIH